MRRFFQVDRILILVLGLAVAYLIGSHLLAQRNLSVVEGEKMSAEQRANASASDAEKVAEPVVELCSRGDQVSEELQNRGVCIFAEQIVRVPGPEGEKGEPGVPGKDGKPGKDRSEEHTSELQSRENLVCRLLLEKKHKTPTEQQ